MSGDPGVLWRRVGSSDVALAAVVGLVVVVTSVVSWGAPPGLRSVSLLGWALIVVACGAMYFRRRYPLVVGVVTLLACMTYYPLVDADGAILVTLIIALYTLASGGRLWAAIVIGLVALAGSAYGELGTGVHPLGDAGLFLLVGWLAAGVAVGAVVTNRRAYLREAEQRARDAERNREEALRRRATEERLRIARDLHDVLGHHISLINVQAGAALHGLERDPERAAAAADTVAALAAIKQASRAALSDLRHTLGVLRHVDEVAPTSPPPNLARLPALVDVAAATGLEVRLETVGATGPVPPAVDLAGYRIVQEALTNVTRHARATKVVVRVAYGEDDVTVEVRDDGRGATTPPQAGNGMRGMRERAVALGGALTAGPGPDGGFEVRAWLPYRTGS